MRISRFIITTLALLSPGLALASHGVNYADMSLTWGLPFALILLSLAICPLIMPTFWHHHYGKIIAMWTVVFLIPYFFNFHLYNTAHLLAHAMITEYIPFILLLLALFTISGGILVMGNLHGSPKTNTFILGLGTVLASVMGTTGAAMLLIRPLLRANDNRKHRMHVIIFFIFLVANIGGGLTPLGDPPLFLGFLKGVSFTWTLFHMFFPVLIASAILLTIFYFLDSHYYKMQNEILPKDPTKDRNIKIYGKRNIVLLALVVATVLMSGIWKPGITFQILGVDIELQNVVRDIIFISLIIISLVFTPKQIRSGNEFEWEPILEVAKIFLGIFITIVPVIEMLKAGEAGHFKALIDLTHDSNGAPINAIYFWMTGSLSAFLDNAPTYLVFFNMASGDAAHLMTEGATTLLAISMGAVFMGAMTYIGNAPNLMVKSIATSKGIKMPSFFGYMLWSVTILGSVFLILTLIYFI